jgi:hypothetical protein
MNDKRGNRQRQNETAAKGGGATAELRTKVQGLKGLGVREQAGTQ